MQWESEYKRLAERAEELGNTATSASIATSWRIIAKGFRNLARLHQAAANGFRAPETERETTED